MNEDVKIMDTMISYAEKMEREGLLRYSFRMIELNNEAMKRKMMDCFFLFQECVTNDRDYLLSSVIDKYGIEKAKKIWNEEEKQKLVEKIKEKVKEWDLDEDVFMGLFSPNVKNKRDRVKSTVSDDKASDYIFIEKKDKIEQINKAFELCFHTIEKSLGMKTEKTSEEMYKTFLEMFEHPYIEFKNEHCLYLSFIEKITDKKEDMIRYVKNWFEKQDKDKIRKRFTDFENTYYLMSQNVAFYICLTEKARILQNFTSMEKIKNYDSEKLKKLKSEYLIISEIEKKIKDA